MALKLTDSNRRSNCYFREIDSLQQDLNYLQLNVENTVLDIVRLENEIDSIDVAGDTLIKVNKDELDVPYSFFNDDVIAYYDFSSSKHIGKDLSGKNNHMGNAGVEHEIDVDGRKFAAYFNRNEHSSFNHFPVDNQRVLTKLTDIDDFKVPEYTISLWFKEQVSESSSASMFCINDYDNNPHPHGTYIDLRTAGNVARFLYVVDGIVLIDRRLAMPANVWHHFVVTMGPGGNTMYVDNILATIFVAGNATIYADLSTLNVDNVSIGGLHENISSVDYEVGSNRYHFPYKGYLSDIIMYNRILDVDEIDNLYNNHIGYAVVVLAGQSNCVGRDIIEEGVDDDYSLFENKVHMFNTYPNIDQSTYAISSLTIYNATNPLPHPDIIDNVSNNGFWRTFVNDLVQYANLPHRMKVLIVPCAQGGTGFLTNDWNVGNQYYNICVSAMQAVLDKDVHVSNQMNKLIAFLWFQGETDITSANLDYASDFDAMLNGYEVEVPYGAFDLDKLAVIVAQISSEYTTVNDSVTPNVLMKPFINDCLQTFGNSKPNYGYVQTDDLNFMSDFIHMRKEGQRITGHRFYDQLVSTLSLANKKVLNNEKIVVNETENKIIIKSETNFEQGLTLNPVNNSDKIDLVLDKYFSCTKTYNCIGAYTGELSFNYIRLGNLVMVTMEMVDFTVVANTSISIIGQADPLLLPSINHVVLTSYRNDKATDEYSACIVSFQTDGNILITAGLALSSNFVATEIIDLRPFSTCYIAQ